MTFETGLIRRPPKVVLHGTEGVGKTTFGVNAPAPAFIDCERGTDNFDVPRTQCSTWNDVVQAVRELYETEHAYQTCVLDTSSSAERLLQNHVAQAGGYDTIEGYPYGKGFTRMAEEFAELLRWFDALIYRGMAVVILSHSHVQQFRDPAGSDYDRWTIVGDKRIVPQIKQWGDCVLFADHDKTVTVEGEGFRERKVAKSWGQRVMFTDHSATHDAKNRYGLPERMELSWAALEAGMAAHFQR